MLSNARALLAMAIGALAAVVPARAEWPKFESFSSNGVLIAYATQGQQGEPVLFLHGWLSSAGINWMLPGITGEVAKEHRVIAMDVRGHGRSDKPAKEEEYGEELVEDVVRLLDHLKIKQAHVVGYSMGGIIAAKLVAKHPDRVISVALCGMGWMKEGGAGQWGFAQIAKNDKNANAYQKCGKSLAKLALSEKELKAIQTPACVIIGDKDGLIKELYIKPLQEVRPDWPVAWIKDGDHISTILKPQFKEEIVVWLKKK